VRSNARDLHQSPLVESRDSASTLDFFRCGFSPSASHLAISSKLQSTELEGSSDGCTGNDEEYDASALVSRKDRKDSLDDEVPRREYHPP